MDGSGIRFGVFEVNRETRELRKHGTRIKLEDQPFEVLAALIENPGEVVNRSTLKARLWPDGTFVNFDKSLTKAVNKVRAALGDSATTPRYIETLSRRGYRFIAPLEKIPADEIRDSSVLEPPPARGLPRQVRLTAIVVCVGVLLGATGLATGRLRGWTRRSAVNRIESIAVLPIQNLSGDGTQEYYVDGLTDQLISRLARIGSIRVISRTSAMRYKGANKTVPEIARELDVDGIVEGSVMRSDGRVFINMKLLHARTDRQLWSGGYDGDASETARLQGQIALAVAHEIGARVTAETKSEFARGGQINVRAYDAYLRGRHLFNERGVEAITEAIGYFEQSLREDPHFALAYSGLADCYSIGWGGRQDPERGAQYARQAVASDPNLAEGHVSLALAYQNEFRFTEAEQELRRSIELSPGYVTAHQFQAIFLLTMGRVAEALAENDRALRLDPFSLPVNNLRGHILVGLRQYGRALEHLRIPLEIARQEIAPREQLARIYWIQQRPVEALAAERDVAKLLNSEILLRGQAEVERAYARSGFRAACLKSAQLKEQAYPSSQAGYPILIALQYGCLNDKEKVLEWLNRLLEKKNYGSAMLLKTAPELDFIRSDPRFHELMKRIGLEP